MIEKMKDIITKIDIIPQLLEERSQLLCGRMFVKSSVDAQEKIAFIEDYILSLLRESKAHLEAIGTEIALLKRRLDHFGVNN